MSLSQGALTWRGRTKLMLHGWACLRWGWRERLLLQLWKVPGWRCQQVAGDLLRRKHNVSEVHLKREEEYVWPLTVTLINIAADGETSQWYLLGASLNYFIYSFMCMDIRWIWGVPEMIHWRGKMKKFWSDCSFLTFSLTFAFWWDVK